MFFRFYTRFFFFCKKKKRKITVFAGGGNRSFVSCPFALGRKLRGISMNPSAGIKVATRQIHWYDVGLLVPSRFKAAGVNCVARARSSGVKTARLALE